MRTSHMSPDEIQEVVDCVEYAIEQMRTSRIAVLTHQSSDDSEEEFDRVIYSMESWLNDLRTIAKDVGVIIVD